MIRSLQKERVKKMLKPEGAPLKILILDETTQNILSPLLRISDLRDCGVTGHFLVNSGRDSKPDAPAIYFVHNGSVLVDEMRRDMYARYYLNSATSFKRNTLEEIAAECSEKRIADKVKSVYDQYLYFVSVHEGLFSLNIERSFVEMDNPETLRAAIGGIMSVLVTVGEKPFILSEGSDIAVALDQKLRNMRSIKQTVKRPLLLILHRTFDIFTPIRHVYSYIELVHDLLNIKLNRTSISESEVYDIDVDSDFFKTNAYLDFPVVAEVVEKELSDYKKEMALRSLSDRSSPEEIAKVLENAPHLQRKNEVISSSLNICMKILSLIKEKRLDEFYHAEESMDKEKILELAESEDKRDILRLALTVLGRKNLELAKQVLKAANIEDSVFDYYQSGVKQGGFREKLSSLLFKKTLPIATAVENALSCIKNQSFKGFRVHDSSGSGFYASEISRIIVYVQGGVTYGEANALKDLENTINIPIILGGSEILNGDEFLNQMREIVAINDNLSK